MAIVFLGLTISGCGGDYLGAWHMINVNSGQLQGDANLITIGDTVVMVDAGYFNEAESAVLPYFKDLGIQKIDHFFISHPHKDHYEGLLALLESGVEVNHLYLRVPPRHICDREIPWGCDMKSVEGLVDTVRGYGVAIHNPSAGFVLNLPNDSNMKILHAQSDDLPETRVDVNDLSLIMKWSINGIDVLFTGDLNTRVGTLLSDDERMQSDFMKMPHHGGTGLAPNSFFDRVDPDYVLVPGPKWIWCGDRGARPRKWVYKKGIPVWVNGINGHIQVKFYKKKTVISPEYISGECKKEAFGQIEWRH